jgi:hypothetical protein
MEEESRPNETSFGSVERARASTLGWWNDLDAKYSARRCEKGLGTLEAVEEAGELLIAVAEGQRRGEEGAARAEQTEARVQKNRRRQCPRWVWLRGAQASNNNS